MNIPSQPDQELEQRLASPLLDVLIRGGLILALAMLCYRVFSPFLQLMVWALILAVTLYPLHQFLASKIGGKQGLAATLLVITGIVLIVTPTAILMSSLGDSVRQLVHDVQNNTLKIPAPRPGVEQWPVVGNQIHDVWSKLHSDLPTMVQSMQPKIGELAKTALGFVASVGGGVLQFLASFIIAGIIMALGSQPVAPARQFSNASSAPTKAASSPDCPPRPFVPSPKGLSGWPLSRPSSSGWPCWSPGFRGQVC